MAAAAVSPIKVGDWVIADGWKQALQVTQVIDERGGRCAVHGLLPDVSMSLLRVVPAPVDEITTTTGTVQARGGKRAHSEVEHSLDTEAKKLRASAEAQLMRAFQIERARALGKVEQTEWLARVVAAAMCAKPDETPFEPVMGAIIQGECQRISIIRGHGQAPQPKPTAWVTDIDPTELSPGEMWYWGRLVSDGPVYLILDQVGRDDGILVFRNPALVSNNAKPIEVRHVPCRW